MCACPLPVRALVCVCLPFTSESIGVCVRVCLPFTSESVCMCVSPFTSESIGVCVCLPFTSESIGTCVLALYQ